MWAVTSKQGFIYIVDSANPCRTQHGGGDQQGRVNVFKPTASGSLQKLGFAEIGGRGPCHTCLHSSEAYIEVCCYESGSVTLLPISSSKGVEGLLLAPVHMLHAATNAAANAAVCAAACAAAYGASNGAANGAAYAARDSYTFQSRELIVFHCSEL